MKSVVALYLALLSPTIAIAQSDDSLIVNLKDGSKLAISLADIDKIVFEQTADVVQDDAAEGNSSRSFPNPTRSVATLMLGTEHQREVEVEILDVDGRMIRRLKCESGANRVLWDGTAASGEIVPSGTYFFRLVGGELPLGKLTIAR